LGLIDLTPTPVGIDFNSLRLNRNPVRCASTGQYHLAVAGGSLRPGMRIAYPPATARWYWPASSEISISATMVYRFTSVILSCVV